MADDERNVEVTPTLRIGLDGVPADPASIMADVREMIAALQRDKLYGPYALHMSHENVKHLNPALYAELEAAGVDVPVELLLDEDGRLVGWRRL